jgi:CHAD domain-containing protein
VSTPPGPSPPPRRADHFLAPVLFGLIAAVRQAAARVAATANGGAGAARGSDPEAIHDFRVALRRLRTGIRPARPVYGERRLRAIGAELRALAQATGALRDEEVLRETLGRLELPARASREVSVWLVQRARQERARRRGVGALIAAPDLGRALGRLTRCLARTRDEEHTAVALAEEALASATRGVEELASAPPSDAAAMHALRIRYKRLRYTAELFAPVLGEDRAAAVAGAAARMQKRLGELHDLDEALVRCARARGLEAAARGAVSRALARARARQGTRLRRDLAGERERLGGVLPGAPPSASR